VEFKIVKIDDTLMGMSPAFRKLCLRPTVQYALRPTTQEELDACRWVVVFLP
jgi:hypothetical protein